MAGTVSEISILHFNDVYHIEARTNEPVGGAARFKTVLNNHPDSLVLFSGDIFAPSLMSTITKGKQMVPVLNALNIHAAMFGNHDFDFGIPQLNELIQDNKFPWLISNVIDKATNLPLCGGKITCMLEWKGKRIGLMGLVELDWLCTLATIDMDSVIYTDFVEKARELAAALKAEGADFIIALTHMRQHNDEKLAREVPEIPLILGGHDHHYQIIPVGNTIICKSGTDFRELTEVKVKFHEGGSTQITTEKLEVTGNIVEDPDVKNVVDEFLRLMDGEMNTVIGETEVELDARFLTLRTQETNLGNFVADIMRTGFKANLALLNGGTIRADDVFTPGALTVRDLTNMLPMEELIIVIELTGDQVWQALENGVSKYPAREGRFPQVSGLSFTFDPARSPGARVTDVRVPENGEPIDRAKLYTMATKEYLARGKDGYDCFENCRKLVDAESAVLLPIMVRNHFEVLAALNSPVPTPRDCQVDRYQELIDRHSPAKRKQERAAAQRSVHVIAPMLEGRITRIGGADSPAL